MSFRPTSAKTGRVACKDWRSQKHFTKRTRPTLSRHRLGFLSSSTLNSLRSTWLLFVACLFHFVCLFVRAGNCGATEAVGVSAKARSGSGSTHLRGLHCHRDHRARARTRPGSDTAKNISLAEYDLDLLTMIFCCCCRWVALLS